MTKRLLLISAMVVLLCAFISHALIKANHSAKMASKMNLQRELGLALAQFNIDHGSFPASLNEPTFTKSINQKLQTLSQNPDLTYNPPTSESTVDQPLLTLKSTDGTFIFYVGGHCGYKK